MPVSFTPNIVSGTHRLSLSSQPALEARLAMQVPALEWWTLLEELTLDNCVLMTSVTLSLPRLRVLSLRGCRALAQARPAPHACVLHVCLAQGAEGRSLPEMTLEDNQCRLYVLDCPLLVMD